jgi:hypothetical protein
LHYWGLNSRLPRQAFYNWHNSFGLIIFQIGSPAFYLRLALDHDPLLMPPTLLVSQVCTTMPGYLLRWGLANFWPGLTPNCSPPNLCLSSSWDYRCVPSHTVLIVALKIGQYHVLQSVFSVPVNTFLQLRTLNFNCTR